MSCSIYYIFAKNASESCGSLEKSLEILLLSFVKVRRPLCKYFSIGSLYCDPLIPASLYNNGFIDTVEFNLIN